MSWKEGYLFVAKLPVNARQALLYAIELAATLRLAEEGFVVVKHGPLLQLTASYFAENYSVERDVALSALTYAGLDLVEAKEFVDRAMAFTKSSSERRVVLGALVLALLEELIGYPALGTVESLETPHDAVVNLFPRDLVEEDPVRSLYNFVGKVIELTKHGCRAVKELYVTALGECGNSEELMALFELLANAEEEDEFRRLLLQNAKLLPVDDVEAFLNAIFYFVNGSYDFVVGEPYSKVAQSAWAAKALADRGAPEEAVRAAQRLRAFSARYVLADAPPTCSDLDVLDERTLNAVLDLLETKEPFRVETTPSVSQEDVELLASLATLATYAFPPPLLAVDVFSRVEPDERRVLEDVIAKFMKRRVPYVYTKKGWDVRKLTGI